MLVTAKLPIYTSSRAEHSKVNQSLDRHRLMIENLCSHKIKSDEFQLKDINESLSSLPHKEGQELVVLLRNHMRRESPPLSSLTFSRFDEQANLIAITTISAEEGNASNLSFQYSKINFRGESEEVHGSLHNCSEVPADLFLERDKLIIEKTISTRIDMTEDYGGDVISSSLNTFLSKAKDSSEIFYENELFGKLFSNSDAKFKDLNEWIKYSYLHSATARKLINYAAHDNIPWEVTCESKEFKADLTNKVLYIPDNYSFKNSKFQAARYYLHELAHRCTGLPDRDGDHKSGPIVQLVNKIMNELGINDVRLEYENISQCDDSGIVGMYKVKKDRIRTIEQIKKEAIGKFGSIDSSEARCFINMAMAESHSEMKKYNREGAFDQALEALTIYRGQQEHAYRIERKNSYQQQDFMKEISKARDREKRDAAMERRGNFNILTDIVNPLTRYVNVFMHNLNTLTAKEMSVGISSLTRLGELLHNHDGMYFADIEKQLGLIQEIKHDLEGIESKGNLSVGLANALSAIEGLDVELKKLNKDKARIAEIDKEIAEGDASRNEVDPHENEIVKSDYNQSGNITPPAVTSHVVANESSKLAQEDKIIIHLYYHGDVPEHIISNVTNTVKNNPNNTVMLWVDDKARKYFSHLQENFSHLDMRDYVELKDVTKESDEKAFSNITKIFSHIENSTYENKGPSLSDLSRLVAAYKFSGLYLDADVVVNEELKSREVFGDSDFKTHISTDEITFQADIDLYDALGFKNKEDSELGKILEGLSSDFSDKYLNRAEEPGELVRINDLVRLKLEKSQEKLTPDDIDDAVSNSEVNAHTMKALKEISISETVGGKIEFKYMGYSG